MSLPELVVGGWITGSWWSSIHGMMRFYRC